MVGVSYLIIIGVFVLYYFLLVFIEKKVVVEAKEIIEKFLAVTLCYAGVSLIYFSLTGNPLFTDDAGGYSTYIFIIGFISVLWAVPNLLEEFSWYKRFIKNGEKTRKRKARDRKKVRR